MKENNVLLSIIIPTYNRKKFLLECLESIYKTKCDFLEIIVIDDGSTDGTSELFTSQKFPFLTYIFQNNKGAPAARNKGIQIAKGEYLQFLDSDDLLCENRFSSLSDFLNEGIYDLVYTGRNLYKEGKIISCERMYPCNDTLTSSDIIKNGFWTSLPIIKTTIARKISWREDLLCHQDFVYFAEFVSLVKKSKFVNNRSVYLRVHDGERISSEISKEKLISLFLSGFYLLPYSTLVSKIYLYKRMIFSLIKLRLNYNLSYLNFMKKAKIKKEYISCLFLVWLFLK